MFYPKTVGEGGFGKCRVYYSKKYKRKVIEKAVGSNFIRMKGANRLRFTTLINEYSKNEDRLKKESAMMMLTRIGKLDCCVEILDFASNPFRIIMEYCEGGDLRNILDKYKVPTSDKIIMISQILDAIRRIHKFGVIHGDLKCENIFLVKKYIPGDFKNIRIKIGDFGLSEIGGNLVYGGTRGFMAPEVEEKGGSFESDIYSIGKVMLELMTQLPVTIIAAINSINLYTIKNKLPKFLYVSEFYNIVILCLLENPDKRPDSELLFSEFHGLMAHWLYCESINAKILENYKIGDKILVDSHKHPLTLSNEQMRQYRGNRWFCDICNNKEDPFLSNTLSFNCSICKYDLCQNCIEIHNYKKINNKLLDKVPKGKKVYVRNHPHPLLLSNKEERNYPNDSWICDICKVIFSDYIFSLHCKKCDYDVCLNCFNENYEERKNDICDCCIIY